jgi:hypothetical protein
MLAGIGRLEARDCDVHSVYEPSQLYLPETLLDADLIVSMPKRKSTSGPAPRCQ